MKKVIVLLLILTVATFSVSAQYIEVKGKAPQTSETGPAADLFNNALKDAFDSIVRDLDNELGGIKSKPSDLLRAFGNSSVFASHGATHRGFGGYNFLAVTAGSMIGIQMPSFSMDDIEALGDDMMEKGDINLGLNPQLFNINVGLNSSFLVEHLYLGARLGFINLENMIDGFAFKSFQFGLTANYQIIPKIDLKFIEWKGVNLGSGFIYQTTTLAYSFDVDQQSETVDHNAHLVVDPRFVFNLDIKTFTIPLEAMTGVRLLFLNIPVGFGADLAFGKTDLRYGMDAKINVVGEEEFVVDKPGSLSVIGGGKEAPSFFNFKFMTGVGFKFGPGVLEIPFTYYFGRNGFNLGITFGAVL